MYPFREGCFAPRNGWYVAAFVHEVGRELLSRWILIEPVVMDRTEAGEAVALDRRRRLQTMMGREQALRTAAG